MSEVLLAMPEDRPPNRKFLEAISRNAAVLDRMIIELLDISEIGAGSFAVREQEVHLPQLVVNVIQGLESRIRKAELSLGVMVVNDRELTIIGDDRRLQWALGHLIDNSIKYTEAGGQIAVAIGRRREGYLLIEVSDTGVGISPRDLPHIFERFYRGEARTPSGKVIDPRGLGQGLFVARAVAEAHGGYLSVASRVGEGARSPWRCRSKSRPTAVVPCPRCPPRPRSTSRRSTPAMRRSLTRVTAISGRPRFGWIGRASRREVCPLNESQGTISGTIMRHFALSFDA